MILKSNQAALQVFLNGQWEYVFCRNETRENPVTTKTRAKALPGRAIDYFQTHFGNHDFRIEHGKTKHRHTEEQLREMEDFF